MVEAVSLERLMDCVECGAPLMPIFYGFPSSELVTASTIGTAILGGCVVEVIDGVQISPEWECPECRSRAQGSAA